MRCAEGGLAPREETVWGTVGDSVYGVVRVLGVVDTFDVYVAHLPKGRERALMPMATLEQDLKTVLAAHWNHFLVSSLFLSSSTLD